MTKAEIVMDELMDAPATAPELAAITGLKAHYIGEILRRLIKRGLVEASQPPEKGGYHGRAGRPGRMYQMKRTGTHA